MWKQALAIRPCLVLNIWKSTVDSSHGTLCPLALCLFVHLVLENGLYQSMDGECLGIRIAANKRILAKFLDGRVQLYWFGSHGLKVWAEIVCTFSDDLFGNSVR